MNGLNAPGRPSRCGFYLRDLHARERLERALRLACHIGARDSTSIWGEPITHLFVFIAPTPAAPIRVRSASLGPKTPGHPVLLMAVDVQLNRALFRAAICSVPDDKFVARRGHRINIIDAAAADDPRPGMKRGGLPGRITIICAAGAIQIPGDHHIMSKAMLPRDFILENPPRSAPVVAPLRTIRLTGPGSRNKIGINDRKVARHVAYHRHESRGAPPGPTRRGEFCPAGPDGRNPFGGDGHLGPLHLPVRSLPSGVARRPSPVRLKPVAQRVDLAG